MNTGRQLTDLRTQDSCCTWPDDSVLASSVPELRSITEMENQHGHLPYLAPKHGMICKICSRILRCQWRAFRKKHLLYDPSNSCSGVFQRIYQHYLTL